MKLAMNLLRNRVHHLVDRLSDEEIDTLWPLLRSLYWDFYVLRAIQDAKRAMTPGDSLTHEEALELIKFL